KIVDVLVHEVGAIASSDDALGFEKSIGGSEYNGWCYFRAKKDGQNGAAESAEHWQIFSPLRGQGYGVIELNRMIQRQFRLEALERARERTQYRKVPKPVGPEEIIYGDKVINVRNLSLGG